jgi:hypothetical protein
VKPEVHFSVSASTSESPNGSTIFPAMPVSAELPSKKTLMHPGTPSAQLSQKD